MMTEERENNDARVSIKETNGKPRKYTGVITILVMLTVGAGIFFYFQKYEHVSEGKFVGPGRCKQCHAKQYASWKKTRMASSFEVLRPGQNAKEKLMAGLDPNKDYTRDPNCLSCHTTGYGLEGGFVSIEKTPELAGVTCEACHGHGGTYVGKVMDPKNPTFTTTEARVAGLVYPPTENVCRMCHNSHSPFVGMNYKFDFKKRVQLGTHEHYQLKYEHGPVGSGNESPTLGGAKP